MKIEISEKTFHFRQPAGTSRGVYTERKSWIIQLTDGERTGIGECAPLPGLSCDDIPDYEKTLRALCDKFEQEGQIDYNLMRPYPSMLFGLETAMLSLLGSSGVKECRSVDNSILRSSGVQECRSVDDTIRLRTLRPQNLIIATCQLVNSSTESSNSSTHQLIYYAITTTRISISSTGRSPRAVFDC